LTPGVQDDALDELGAEKVAECGQAAEIGAAR
jgi:hypothetical protein